MTIEQCCMGIFCFAPIDTSVPKFFGFSEFLTSLALMVLAWTTSDVRYRFRILSAPISLQHRAFKIVTTIGVLTLLTDLWRAEQWPVPTFIPMTTGLWQAIMGGSLLLTFISWIRLAFIHPPVYNIYNARRFTQALYTFIIKGSKEELPIVADELTRSIKSIVGFSTEEQRNTNNNQDAQNYANKILDLMADKRFCRAIATSSPMTAISLYREMSNNKKYDIPVKLFTKNLFEEAIGDRTSLIYHEISRYNSGHTKHQDQLIHILFSNYEMTETIGALLYPNMTKHTWDPDQWEVYFQIILITMESYNTKKHGSYSWILKNALDDARQATIDSHALSTTPYISVNNEYAKRIRMAIEFTRKCILIINRKWIPGNIKIKTWHKNRDLCEHGIVIESIYDHIANLMFWILWDVSHIENPEWVKHIENYFIFSVITCNYKAVDAEKIIQAKFRRMIYDDISSMRRTPNQRLAREIRLLLNMTGLKKLGYKRGYGNSILQKIVHGWLRQNYDWLYINNQEIAETCLGENTVYDNINHRIVREYLSSSGAGKEYVYLDIDPAVSPLASSSPTPAEH